MGTPGWLLNIIVGFLEERTLIVNYKNLKSESKDMPAGGPQGTILGMFLFLILINGAGFPVANRKLGIRITSASKKRKQINNNHWKYVAESIDLKEKLETDEENTLEKPIPFHSRTK